MSVTYLVATLGRLTLEPTLRSIVSQQIVGDELLVIGWSRNEYIRTMATAFGARFIDCPPGADWGATERNLAAKHATGDYLAFLDDDDIAADGARMAIEDGMGAHAGSPLIFRMQYGRSGPILWDAQNLCMGNVGTPMFVVPNDPAKLGTWGSRYGGDFDFIRSSGWQEEEFVWRSDVIALIRPQS